MLNGVGGEFGGGGEEGKGGVGVGGGVDFVLRGPNPFLISQQIVMCLI